MKIKRWLQRGAFIILGLVVLALAYNTVSAQRDLFRAAKLEVEEETYPAYTDLAYSKLQLGDSKGAIVEFDKAEELHSSQCINIYIGRGLAYLEEGDKETALAEFNAAITLDPNSADAYFYRGFAFLKMGDYEAAVADNDQAIALGATGDSYFNRGTALLLSGRVNEGFVDYLQGLQARGEAFSTAETDENDE